MRRVGSGGRTNATRAGLVEPDDELVHESHADEPVALGQHARRGITRLGERGRERPELSITDHERVDRAEVDARRRAEGRLPLATGQCDAGLLRQCMPFDRGAEEVHGCIRARVEDEESVAAARVRALHPRLASLHFDGDPIGIGR